MLEETKFNGIDAVKIINRKGDELTILTGVGPRIISYKTSDFNRNFFYVNEKDFENYIQNPENWYIFGGTRIWLSPETKASYIPDNKKCHVSKDEKNNKLVVYSEPDKELKIVKKITIQPLEKSFRITYSIINTSEYLLQGGIWVLSCLEPLTGFKIYIPWGEEREDEETNDKKIRQAGLKEQDKFNKFKWNIKEIKFWKSWLGVKTNILSKQWKQTEEFFIIEPSGETGKIGLSNRMGYAIYTDGKFSFVKYSPYIESANYPDDGCSFEFYTSREFYEVETLSPLFTLKPLKEYIHTELWWAGTEKIDLSSISSAKMDIKKLLI